VDPTGWVQSVAGNDVKVPPAALNNLLVTVLTSMRCCLSFVVGDATWLPSQSAVGIEVTCAIGSEASRVQVLPVEIIDLLCYLWVNLTEEN